MKIGHARVSTEDQNLALQLEALQAEGCGQVFQYMAAQLMASDRSQREVAKALGVGVSTLREAMKGRTETGAVPPVGIAA